MACIIMPHYALSASGSRLSSWIMKQSLGRLNKYNKALDNGLVHSGGNPKKYVEQKEKIKYVATRRSGS